MPAAEGVAGKRPRIKCFWVRDPRRIREDGAGPAHLPSDLDAAARARPPEGAQARFGGGVGWRTLVRHQAGAVVATAVDFTTMILLVSKVGWSPTAGTAISAPLGGVTNFALGRAWIFRAHRGRWWAQGIRYALVSASSAWWNTLGEHVAHDVAGVQYVLARALVSVLVSLFWNFPLHRMWVFRDTAEAH